MNIVFIILIIATLFALIVFSFLKALESLINYLEARNEENWKDPSSTRHDIVLNNETGELESDQKPILPFE